MYGKRYMVTTEKKLGSTSPLFATFHTSPASISTFKYHLLYKQTSDQFSLAYLGGGNLFLWASQSADTANWTQECRSQNCTLNSKYNTKVAGGLAAQPCTNLAWCSTQEDQKSWNDPPHQPPLQFTKQQPKVWKDQDPGTTQPEGNFIPL